MTDPDPAPAANPDPQAGNGQPNPAIPDAAPSTLTAEQLAQVLADTRKEAAEYRRKLREAEGKLTDAEKAQAAEAEKQKAEQGKYQELYEAEKAKAAEAADRLARMEFDQQRRDAAQAAGIPQLWQRLQGGTPEELAEDAKGLAEIMQANATPVAQPANGRTPTQPTPPPQGQRGLTDEERRAKARSTW